MVTAMPAVLPPVMEDGGRKLGVKARLILDVMVTLAVAKALGWVTDAAVIVTCPLGTMDGAV
jgi:hypothetical protein